MRYQIDTHHRASSSQSLFAMDCHCAFLRKLCFDKAQEFLRLFHRRRFAVWHWKAHKSEACGLIDPRVGGNVQSGYNRADAR